MELFLKPGINDTQASAVLEVRSNTAPIGHIILLPNQLDALIQQLSACRKLLYPAIPQDCDYGGSVLHNPAFTVVHANAAGEVGLNVRHTGLGWLSFAFRADDAEALAGKLQAVARSTPANVVHLDLQR